MAAAAKPHLNPAYLALAIRLQESAADLSNCDIATRLSDEIGDHHRGTGKWAYFICYFGDADSGDVVYCCDGDTCMASYEISGTGGKAAKCIIDFEGCRNVVPRTTYEEEAEDSDHYTAMEESYRKETLYGDLPIYERFISKAERDEAKEANFAGKGKSFPILKPEDVRAAAASIGRAGSGNYGPATLKRNIITIANKKGWSKYLPKAWREGGDTAKESAVSESQGGQLRLVESVAFAQDITIREALAPGRKIKLIAPGKGSTAYYTAEALKQAAADNIFRAGTPMRIDHPTDAQESERPEGSVKDWGAVLGSDAVYLESYVGKDGKDAGAGLYSEVRPFSDRAQFIDERAPYAGVSIAANGRALMESGKAVMRDGVPVLERFVSADGVDMVTRAGAGGKFLSLSEAARPVATNPTQEATEMAEGMTATQAAEALKAAAGETANVSLLISEAVAKATAPLLERTRKQDAEAEAKGLLEAVDWPRTAKDYILREAMKQTLPVTAEGQLDTAKFREGFVAMAKEFARALGASTGGANVIGLGASAFVSEADAAEQQKQRESLRAREAKQREDETDSMVSVFESLGMPKDAAKFAAVGRNAA